MRPEELDQMGLYFKGLGRRHIPVVLIYDIAYIDYYDYDAGREGLRQVTEYPDNVLVLVSVSASKTFALYGMRLGALVAINKDEDVINDFKEASTVACRTRWGSPNRIAVSIFNHISTNKDLRDVFLKELNAASSLLKERAELVIQKAKEYQIPLYPYENGFFATVKLDHSERLYEFLRKENIYTVPFTLGLRLAISSLALNQIDITMKKIKEYLDNEKQSV
jgi:aspartate/tyrosine/aromatic aminotransferase